MKGFSTLPHPPPLQHSFNVYTNPLAGGGVQEEILLGIAKCMLSVLVCELDDQTLQFDRRG